MIYLLCYLRIVIHFFNIYVSHIYHVLYSIILKINVSTYRIRVVSDTCIVSVHHIELKKYLLKSVN